LSPRYGRGSPVGPSATVVRPRHRLLYYHSTLAHPGRAGPRWGEPAASRNDLVVCVCNSFSSFSLVLWHVSGVEAAGAAVATCPENPDGKHSGERRRSSEESSFSSARSTSFSLAFTFSLSLFFSRFLRHHCFLFAFTVRERRRLHASRPPPSAPRGACPSFGGSSIQDRCN
jgi:hypothetical protein